MCDPHLDFERFVGANSFLAAAYWSEFPGATDLTHPGPSPTVSSRGGICFPSGSGTKVEGPRRFQTPSWRPVPTALPRQPRQEAPRSGSGPEVSPGDDPARAHLPLPGNRSAAPPPAPRPGSRGPRTHRAMAQPETGPSTSSGRIQTGTDLWAGRPSWGFRLPASGSAVSCE